jgi:retinal rod rhodopsin-sensitive cGMP 3',5'-cyclic phosphodiesterase subunit delta
MEDKDSFYETKDQQELYRVKREDSGVELGEAKDVAVADAKDSYDDKDIDGVLSAQHGLSINWMNMKDALTGEVLWRSGQIRMEEEERAVIPREILKCRSVSREMNFSSLNEMSAFHIEQYVYFHGHCIEQWSFHFGFVMRNSTNGWQQIIEAADPDKMLDPDAMSGNILFETHFFDGENLLCKNMVRIFYE